MDLRNYVGGMFSALIEDAREHAKAVLEDHPRVVEVLTHLVSAEQAFLSALDTTPAAVVAPEDPGAENGAQAPAQATADPTTAEAATDSGGAGTVHAADGQADDSADPGPAATEPAVPMPGADHPVTGPVDVAVVPGRDVPVTHVPAE